MSRYSIILPVFNGGDYFKDCVKSILAQTLNDFNLLILDNCSTDDTVAWAEALHDDRILIYKTPVPLGMENNWARIATIPKNEYMTIIGHDDLLHPGYLETMNTLIAANPQASLYQSHFRYIDAKGNMLRACKAMPAKMNAAEFLEAEINQTMDSMGTGYMMRSSDYDALGGISPRYPNLIFADYELWMKLIMQHSLVIAAEESFSYRIHNNLSKTTNGEAYQQAFGEYMLFLNSIKGSSVEMAACIELYGRKMLLYFCGSLSHRLLRTAVAERKITVRAFVDNCENYAKMLIPSQSFHPLRKPGIFLQSCWITRLGLPFSSCIGKLNIRIRSKQLVQQ